MNQNTEDKISLLIQESEKEREAAQPDYVTKKADKAIQKADVEAPSEHDVEAPELSDSSTAASILNKLGQAADEAN